MDVVKTARTAALGAVFLSAMAVSSFAGPEGYCDAYARDVANRKARNSGTDVFAGAALGALTGAAVGEAVSNSKGATGAVIGGAGGLALGAGSANGKWRRAYINSYEDCMGQYEEEQQQVAAQEPAQEPAEEPAPEPPKKAAGKPQPGSQAWNRACDQRYRSFNPKTGSYKSLSGKYRKCQL